jgi:SAM-dependent methyltransferase
LHGKFLVSNIEDLVKGNEGRYDVVTFFEVLEHMADPVSFIRSVFLSLKEGGYAACSVPNRERMRIPMLLFPEREYPPSHLTYWSKDAITKFFENHGFSIVSITEEPLKLLDEMWSFGIIQRCRLDVLAHIFTRGVRPDSELSLEGKSSLKSGFRKKLLMVGAIFYQVVLSTVVGVITIPFRLLLRRSGFSMLIIAKKKAV